jgi:hypothetical protein
MLTDPYFCLFLTRYEITVTVDRSDPSHPTFSVTGTNSEFPAYEVYINQQLAYHYDPVPNGYGPPRLFFFDWTVYSLGSLNP